LIDFEKRTREPKRGVDETSAEEARDNFRNEMAEVKDGTLHYFQLVIDKVWEGHINWADWNPPKIKLAMFRKTAPSCHEADWPGLEK